MIKAVIFDLARTLVFPKDTTYKGGLNDLYKLKSADTGFKFFDYFVLNSPLLDYIDQIRSTVPVYIFTSDSMQNDQAIFPRLSEMFIKIYSARDMGLKKTDPEVYTKIASEIKNSAEEILFVDDSQSNCSSAKLAGLIAIQHTNNTETINLITGLLN